MATNEIAAAVQCGQADVLKLWKEVRKFAIKQGLRWLRALDGKGGTTLDDLEQCAFLAMLDALESWNIDSGSFIGWYAYQRRGRRRVSRKRRSFFLLAEARRIHP